MAEAMAAQQLWWQRSNGGAAMAAQQWRRSDGAQRWQRRWRCNDGLGSAAAAMAMAAQRWVSMILTPGVYYSLVFATSTYQSKVLAFIGDQRATKEPTPICLPTTKTWDWHTGDAVMDFDKFIKFHNVEANKGNLWTPTVGDGAPAKLKVPNLVAIPNMLVDLLRNQGFAVTPYNVLASIKDFVQQSGEPGHHWEYIRK